jgi:hypothetical protein
MCSSSEETASVESMLFFKAFAQFRAIDANTIATSCDF